MAETSPAMTAWGVSKTMPRRTDIKSILIIGAGPIVIGQACEFDYSGAQFRRADKRSVIRQIRCGGDIGGWRFAYPPYGTVYGMPHA
jgi:hypothetical protein